MKAHPPLHRPRPARLACILAIAAVALAAGCKRHSPDTAEKSGPPARIVVQLDWVPEPEHGGFFQAQARGWFARAGLEVVLSPGGAHTYGPQKVATGQAQIGQADSTTVLLGISEGLPLVNVGAVFQNDPSVLMLHADNPVTRFEDLQGKTIMARPEWLFLPYLKKKYGVTVNIIPQSFQVANFIANRDFIQQGFYIAEPFHIIRGGAAPPRFLYVWDAGFDAYTVLYANRRWARENPAALRAFLSAYAAGWRDYLTGDPTPAHTAIKAANPNCTDDFLDWSRRQIIAERLVTGRDRGAGDLSAIGRIEPARFRRQIDILEELGSVPPGRLSPETVMSAEFLP